MSGAEILPTVAGIVLVAVAAAFALLPLVRASTSDAVSPAGTQLPARFALYRQILDLELDLQLGKLSRADFEVSSRELLAEAGEALRAEQGDMGQLDAEIEREIAAARAAFAAARATHLAETPS